MREWGGQSWWKGLQVQRPGGRRAGRTEHSAFSRFPKHPFAWRHMWATQTDTSGPTRRKGVCSGFFLPDTQGSPRAWFAPKAPVGKGKESEVLVMNLHPVTY